MSQTKAQLVGSVGVSTADSLTVFTRVKTGIAITVNPCVDFDGRLINFDRKKN